MADDRDLEGRVFLAMQQLAAPPEDTSLLGGVAWLGELRLIFQWRTTEVVCGSWKSVPERVVPFLREFSGGVFEKTGTYTVLVGRKPEAAPWWAIDVEVRQLQSSKGNNTTITFKLREWKEGDVKHGW